MAKIGYVTDLHLSNKLPGRTMGLLKKMVNVRSTVDAYIFGGDTFAIAGKQNWEGFINRPIDRSELKERIRESRSMVDEYLPLIMDAADCKPVFMLQGNADAIAFRYTAKNIDKYPNLRLVNNVPIEFCGHYIVGVGGIEPDNADAAKIKINNPWYGGVLYPSDYIARLLKTALTRNIPWRKTILMTHQPAYGYADGCAGEHNGSEIVLQFILQKKPPIHLTGHMHYTPLADIKDKKYIEERTTATIGYGTGDKTLSINPGGGDLHDLPGGVRMKILTLED